jgi:hypothetical protein
MPRPFSPCLIDAHNVNDLGRGVLLLNATDGALFTSKVEYIRIKNEIEAV